MIFTKNFIYIALINFFVLMAYYMLFVISTPYAIGVFDVSASLGGFVAGLILIGCLCGRFCAGKMVLSLGFKKLLFAGVGIYISSLALYLVIDNLYLFMAVRFISGIGIGCVGTVTSILIVHIIPKEAQGQGINYFSLSAVMAMAIGPFLGIYMMLHVSFHTIFAFCLAVGIISFVFALFVSYPATEKHHKTSGGFHLSEYISYAIIPIAIVTLLVTAGYGCLQAFLPVYAKEIDMTQAASVFFLVYAVAAFVSRPFTGKSFDKRGANIIIYPALVSTIIGFAILALAQSPSTMLLSAVFLGLGIANFQTTIQAICVKLSHGKSVPQAISTYFIFMELGIGMGPYLYGFLVPHIGFEGLFGSTAVITLCCILLYYLVYGRKAYTM
jgi:MFS family permease